VAGAEGFEPSALGFGVRPGVDGGRWWSVANSQHRPTSVPAGGVGCTAWLYVAPSRAGGEIAT